jgi:hypothetical protein
VHRRDCGLQREPARRAPPQREMDERDTLGDFVVVPARPVLLFEKQELPVRASCACRDARR